MVEILPLLLRRASHILADSFSRSFMDKLMPCNQLLVITGAEKDRVLAIEKVHLLPQASSLASLRFVSRSSSLQFLVKLYLPEGT